MSKAGQKRLNALYKNEKGFTLVELIVVLVIIAILAALVIPVFFGFIDNAHKKQVIARAETALTSTQAALSDIYSSNDNKYTPEKREQTRKNAKASEETAFTVWNVKPLYDEPYEGQPATKAIVEEIGSYTIGRALYQDDDSSYAAYNGSEWAVFDKIDEAEDYIAKADINEQSVIYVWPNADDTAFMPENPADDPADDDDEPTGEPDTKIVHLLKAAKDRAVFSDENGSYTQDSIDVVFNIDAYGNRSWDWNWNKDSESSNWVFKNLSNILFLKLKRGYVFSNWRELDGTKTAINANDIADYVFREDKKEIKDFYFEARVTPRPDLQDYVILSNAGIKGFISSQTVNGFVWSDDDVEEIDDIKSRHPGGAVVDNGETQESGHYLYAWIDNGILNWWTNAAIAFMPADCDGMFKACGGMSTFSFAGFDTSKMESAKEMFADCTGLKSIDFDGVFQAEKLRDLTGCFKNCTGFDAINLSAVTELSAEIDLTETFFHTVNTASITFGPAFKKSEIVSLCKTFRMTEVDNYDLKENEGYSKLKTLDLSGWKVSRVKNCEETFRGCDSLEAIKFGTEWNLDDVESMYGMFWDCQKLNPDDGQGFLHQVSTGDRLVQMEELFNKAYGITSIDLSGINPTNVTSMRSAFKSTKNLTTLNLSAWKAENGKQPKKIESMRQMFVDSTVEYIDMSYWDLSNLKVMFSTFNGCKNAVINIEGWNDAELCPKGGKLQTVAYAFNNCKAFTGVDGVLDLSNWDTTNLKGSVRLGGTGSYGYWNDLMAAMENMFSGCSSLVEINLSGWNVENVTSVKNFFSGCTRLERVYIRSWNLKKVTSISGLFRDCALLEEVDISKWDAPNITDMSDLFSGCKKLKSVDLSKFNSGDLKNIKGMFRNCESLVEIDLKEFNTAKVTDMSDLFSGCKKLTTVDAKLLKTANVNNMSGMFRNCVSLTVDKLDLSQINTAKVTDMSNMFSGCTGLTTIDISAFDTGKVIRMKEMFSGAETLTSIKTGAKFTTEAVINMEGMFSGCSSFMNIPVDKLNTSSATHLTNMFSDCSALTALDLKHFDVTNVVSISGIFSGCTKLAELDLSGWKLNKAGEISRMFKGCKTLATIKLDDFAASAATNMKEMFCDCSSLTDISMNGFTTANVTNMSGMFRGCSSLSTVDLSDMDLKKVTDISYMFANCTALNNPTVKSLSMNAVTKINNMFEGCSSMTALDISGWYMPVMNNSNSVFSNCVSLKELNISGWTCTLARIKTMLTPVKNNIEVLDLSDCNLSSRANMSEMFKGYAKLRSIDLSGFKTAGVTNMSNMFNGCVNLESIDISSPEFDVADVQNTQGMFYNCYSLKSIDFGSEVKMFEKVENMQEMFANCISLNVSREGMSKLGTGATLKNAKKVFVGCYSMQVISVEGFDLTSVEALDSIFDMSGWIQGKSYTLSNGKTVVVDNKLTTIYFGQNTDHNIKSNSGVGSMFKQCVNLTTIFVYPGTDLRIDGKKNSTFSGAVSLEGGNGTKYKTSDSKCAWSQYAHIDGDDGTEGYFTKHPDAGN